MQATYTKEATERILLHTFMHKASSPLAKACGAMASFPYAPDTPAIVEALVRRLELHMRLTEEK